MLESIPLVDVFGHDKSVLSLIHLLLVHCLDCCFRLVVGHIGNEALPWFMDGVTENGAKRRKHIEELLRGGFLRETPYKDVIEDGPDLDIQVVSIPVASVESSDGLLGAVFALELNEPNAGRAFRN